MEVNYFTASNGIGYRMQEMSFNSFADTRLNHVVGRGRQVLHRPNTQGITTAQTRHWSIAWDNDFGVSWRAENEDVIQVGQNAERMIVTIGDEIFGVRLNGTYTFDQFNVGRSIGRGMFRAVMPWRWGENWREYDTITRHFTLEQFFNDIMTRVSSVATTDRQSRYGTTVIPFARFSNYFEISRLNPRNQWESLRQVDFGASEEFIHYFAVRVNVHRSGVVRANQSLFRQVGAEGAGFNLTTGGSYNDYWQYTVSQTVTERDFTLRYSPSFNGYFMSLSTDILLRLRGLDNANIFADIDLQGAHLDGRLVVGFDTGAFEGLHIQRLTLNSNTNQDFVIMRTSINSCVQIVASDNINVIGGGL